MLILSTPPDPNWLYSSIAQSSAAIVAIIGGFITSTLLLRNSERSTLVSRCLERELEVRTLKAQRDDLSGTHSRRLVDFLIEDRFRDILGFEPMPSADEARRRLGAADIPLDIFVSVWHKTVEVIASERKRIQEDLERYGDDEFVFEEWIKKNRIDMSSRDRWIAKEVFHHILLRPTLKPQKKPTALSGLAALHTFSLPTVPPPLLESASATQWKIHREEERNRELLGYRDQLSGIKGRLQLVQADLDQLNDHLRNFRYPPYLRTGLVILGVFTLTGIILPFVLMPQADNEYTAFTKGLAIGGFLVGLLLLVWYMWRLMAELSPRPESGVAQGGTGWTAPARRRFLAVRRLWRWARRAKAGSGAVVGGFVVYPRVAYKVREDPSGSDGKRFVADGPFCPTCGARGTGGSSDSFLKCPLCGWQITLEELSWHFDLRAEAIIEATCSALRAAGKPVVVDPNKKLDTVRLFYLHKDVQNLLDTGWDELAWLEAHGHEVARPGPGNGNEP